MRIDGFQNVPAILQSFPQEKSPATEAKGDTTGASSVSLSSFAEVLQSLQRESAAAAKARGARVEELAQQVQAGKQTVDLEQLAANLVNSHVVDVKG